MMYRLVTVWRDDEEKDSPILRSARDFPTEQEADAWVVAVVSAGVARFDIRTEPMENRAHLIATFVPIGRIVGWFIWELPDDTPMWAGGGFHSG